ncbi:MAG: aldo/keto reductase, partial [SAR202 cluster bacterium]|nr:aldo/keto reductase [SAR202 cluster bacterium]
MRYQQLGETDLNVSEAGFGVWTVATNWWGKIEPDDAVFLLQKAFDLGVNFFDTADAYS